MQLPFSKYNLSSKLLLFILFLALVNSCKKDDDPPQATEEGAEVVYDWYKLMSRIQRNTTPAPVVIANNRAFGYVGVGLYEAVRPGIDGSVSLSTKLFQMPAMPAPSGDDYLWGASANAALSSLFRQFLAGLTDANKASMDSLENAYNDRFRTATSDAVISRSQAFGRSIATAIFNWSTSDNFSLAATGYVLPVFPGSWVPTPPGFAAPVGPFLKDSRPFLQSTLTATAPALPFDYSEVVVSPFYLAAKEVYDIGKSLTAEQKAIANHWADVGGVGVGFPPPNHFFATITGVLESKGAGLAKAAEIYAKTGIAGKDAFITVWKVKFQYPLLRPITYINKVIDANWQSYLVTPPYPDYPSGLAGIVTPILQVLLREFGDISFTDNIYGGNGSAPRQYASISAMIEEAAVSRVYAGIHYRFTQNATIVMGKEMGNRIADIDLY